MCLITKWNLFQVINVFLLFVLFFFIETVGRDLFSYLVINKYVILLQFYIVTIIFVVLGFNYLTIRFQINKKESNIFNTSFWRKAPIFFGGCLLLLCGVFLYFGLKSGDFSFVEEIRWIIYIFLTLFISFSYLLAVSIAAKFNDSPKSVIKISFWGTFVTLIISIFLV